MSVSRQLGHASPATTLNVYAHLFEQADHAAAREALKASYAAPAGPETGPTASLTDHQG